MTFRRPILIVQSTIFQLAQQMPDRGAHLQLLSSSNERREMGRNKVIGLSNLSELMKGDKRQEHIGNRFVDHKMQQLNRISSHLFREQNQRPTIAPGRKNFLEGDIKAERGKLQRSWSLDQFCILQLPR